MRHGRDERAFHRGLPYELVEAGVVLHGSGHRISKRANLYGCVVGDGTLVGAFVEVQGDVTIGARCKIESHSFLCAGVEIGDDVFVGHGVMFTNDRWPRANSRDFELQRTVVEDGASIGSGATILPGVRIGRHAMVGAGSVVVEDVPAGYVVYGNPARWHGSQTVARDR